MLFQAAQFAGGILSKYWKFLLPILLVASAYWWVSDKISDAEKVGYKHGVEQTDKKWNKKVAEENAANREKEALAQDIVNKLGDKFVQEAAARSTRAERATDTLQTIIRNNTVYTDCKVSPEVIEIRNQVRAEGPK